MTQKNRAWCFTINSITVPDWNAFDLEGLFDMEFVTRYVYQYEMGGTTGRPHIQGYIQFKDARALNYIKSRLPNNPHCEPARGSFVQNYAYCTKDDTRVPNTEPVVYGGFDAYPDEMFDLLAHESFSETYL